MKLNMVRPIRKKMTRDASRRSFLKDRVSTMVDMEDAFEDAALAMLLTRELNHMDL
jgi:hypothetical protein